MYDLAAKGMEIDLELRKKLIRLLDLKHKLEKERKEESNPIKEKEIDDNLLAIEELIGKIRYHSIDFLEILEKQNENTIK